MLGIRVIPTLLLDEARLVKTRRFKKPLYVGDPINVVKIFNEKEVDELIITDISASRAGREPNFALIEQIASEAFMPVCYGGAVRTVEQARALLRLGVEKIAVNSIALEEPQFVTRLADRFGSQCVVAAIDVKRTLLGQAQVWSYSKTPVPERDPVSWAKRLVQAGAGEVLLTNVDRDGTMLGYDLALLRSFAGRLTAPLLASGGASTVENMDLAIRAGGLSGLAVGARFVFYGRLNGVLVTYLTPAEQAFLSRTRPEQQILRSTQSGSAG